MLVLSVEGSDLERTLARVAAFEGFFDALEVRMGDRPAAEQEIALFRQLRVPLCYTVGQNYPFSLTAQAFSPFLIDVPWQVPFETLSTIRDFFPEALIQGSAHDDALPPLLLLAQMREKNFDAMKIAKTVQSTQETIDLLNVLATHAQGARLTCVPMGMAGQFGRLLAPTMNSFLSFCCLPGAPTAPGQIDIETMHALYHAKEVSPKTVRYGLIGDPVHNSPSHKTHTRLLRHFGEDGLYVKIPFFDGDIRSIESLGFSGVSVTTPLKMVCGTENSPVNTLKWVDGELLRTNTDAPALIDALTERTSLSEAKVLLLGAGSVGTAVLRALLDSGANVFVFNRTHEKAVRLADGIGGTAVRSLQPKNQYDIVVNATSAHDSFPFPKEFTSLPWQKWGCLVAAEFALSATPFLETASLAGVVTISGEELWSRQAAKQFHWWCGIDEREVFLYLMKTVSSL